MKYIVIKNDKNLGSSESYYWMGASLFVSLITLYFLCKAYFFDNDSDTTKISGNIIIVCICSFIFFFLRSKIKYEYLFIFKEETKQLWFKPYKKDKVSIETLLLKLNHGENFDFQKINMMNITNIYIYEYRVNGSIAERKLIFKLLGDTKKFEIFIDLQKHLYFDSQLNLLINSIVNYNPAIHIGA